MLILPLLTFLAVGDPGTDWFADLTRDGFCRVAVHVAGPQDMASRVGRYGMVLSALEEPAIRERMSEDRVIVRLLYLPSFDDPVSVRIERERDGKATITTRVFEKTWNERVPGRANWDLLTDDERRQVRNATFLAEHVWLPGRLVVSETRPLTDAEWARIENAMEEADLDDGFRDEAPMGARDGVRWVFEHAEGATNNRVETWSPQKGPLYELGELLFHLSAWSR